jgi:hypothetical protein
MRRTASGSSPIEARTTSASPASESRKTAIVSTPSVCRMPLEQLVEQVVEGQVGQGGIRDRLHAAHALATASASAGRPARRPAGAPAPPRSAFAR